MPNFFCQNEIELEDINELLKTSAITDIDIPYARHYDPRFVYFLLTFWSSFMYCDIWPYVWLVFKSGLKSRAGYSGARTVGLFKSDKSFWGDNSYFDIINE